MNLIKDLPGPLLVFLGAVSLSFGGLIVKSFEGSTLWQILFWRSFFFIIVITIFLLITYKKKIFNVLYISGLPGLIGGIILSVGFVSYVFAMYETTVANTNFIIQTQAIFLAIFGYLFLKEKISKITLTSIILAISKNKFPGSQISLDALCKRYKIDNSRRVKHTALIDCELLSKVYVNLFDQKEPLLNFEDTDKVISLSDNKNLTYCKKVIKPSDQEIENHKLFLKTYLLQNKLGDF